MVLLNTEKGRKLFETVKDRMNVVPAELDNCLQPNMLHPSEIHPDRDAFEQDYISHNFKYVMCKYGDLGWKCNLDINYAN